jgi:hypothetical protein
MAEEATMNPVTADASAAAILEGFRRAMADHPPVPAADDGVVTLTDVVESATEHAHGLAARLPGTGERIDRSA